MVPTPGPIVSGVLQMSTFGVLCVCFTKYLVVSRLLWGGSGLMLSSKTNSVDQELENSSSRDLA